MNISSFAIANRLILYALLNLWTDFAVAEDHDSRAIIQLDSIIVTAQHREQNVLDLPMSVGVISGAEIEATGVKKLYDLQYSIPGLQIIENSGDGADRIIIRGISPPGANLPTVGRFVDGVPVNVERTGFGVSIPVYDMERIEVLRGPQGTLYGEGSVGGTIRYLSRQPDLDDEYDGFLQLNPSTVSDGEPGVTVTMAADLPLNSDTFGIRFAGHFDSLPGYIDSSRFGDNVNDGLRGSIRLNSIWMPSDNFDVSVSYQRYDSSINAPNHSKKDFSTDFFIDKPMVEDHYNILNAIINVDLSIATLQSISGWFKRDSERILDFTSFYDTISPFNIVGNFDVPFTTATDSESFYQELRLFNEQDNGNFWQVGATYRHSKFVNNVASRNRPDDFGAQFLKGSFASKTEAWSVYADYEAHLGETLTLSLGGRYYHDRRTANNDITFFLFSFDPITGAPNLLDQTLNKTVQNDSVTWRANIKWDYMREHSAYFSFAQGFRSGGIQPVDVGTTGLSETFKPEKLTSYELGLRGIFKTLNVQYEIAAYLNDYDDIQVFVPNSFNLQTFDNAGEAQIIGIEASSTWKPFKGLTIGASIGINDNEYKEDNLIHQKGDSLDFVSDFNYSATVAYQHPLAYGLTGLIRMDFQGLDSYRVATAPSPAPIAKADPQNLLNLRIGVFNPDWNISFYVTNLSNEKAVTFPSSINQSEPVLTRPRSYGAILSIQF